MEIRRAEWPERTCREPVHNRYSSYWCELPDLHKGPCVSFSVRESVTRRQAWEDQEATGAPQSPQDDESKDQTP